MDSNRFDELTRSLVSKRDRRGVLKSIGATALGAVGVFGLGGVTSAAKADKVSFCHLNDEGTYDYITVSGNAAPAHRRHGDIESPNFATDLNNCGGCGNIRTAPENATALCGENGCDFSCNADFELNEAGDGCVSTALCPPGFEALNGGCFQIVAGLDQSLCNNSCNVYGSVVDSGNYLCASGTATSCDETSDCPAGQACFAGAFCISVC